MAQIKENNSGYKLYWVCPTPYGYYPFIWYQFYEVGAITTPFYEEETEILSDPLWVRQPKSQLQHLDSTTHTSS